MQSQLHIPEGIRFQCTACGHCCHEYPVPLTEHDVMRLREADPEAAAGTITLLRDSEKSQAGLTGFSYSLDKPDGNCSFLTEDKQCRVHVTAKPSMCKLFPYTFMHCPDGVKVGLSFASTGVLLNSGTPLTEQQALLKELGVLFESMHPGLAGERQSAWKEAEFVTDSILDYPDFTDFSDPYLRRLEKLMAQSGNSGASSHHADSALKVLSNMYDVLVGSLPDEMLDPLRRRFVHLSANRLDSYLLMPLYRAYLVGSEPVREGDIGGAVMTYFNNEARELYFIVNEKKITFAELSDLRLDPLTAEENDLITRFVYVKLFSRLYFGPGFSMLTLLSGLFHLTALTTLLMVALKIESLKAKPEGVVVKPRIERLRELVREVDRRLAAVAYSRDTGSMFELFALDPQRVRRFLVLAN